MIELDDIGGLLALKIDDAQLVAEAQLKRGGRLRCQNCLIHLLLWRRRCVAVSTRVTATERRRYNAQLAFNARKDTYLTPLEMARANSPPRVGRNTAGLRSVRRNRSASD